MSTMPNVPVHMRRNRFEPVADLARLRAEAPVSKLEWTPGLMPVSAWLVTRYEDVREVLSDAGRFSNVPRPPPGSADEKLVASLPGILSSCDPPEHTRLRKMLTPEFTAKRLRRMQPRVETIVSDCLDEMAKAGPPIDIVEEFAKRIPALVVCELLGLPYDEGIEFLRNITTSQEANRSPQEQSELRNRARGHMTEAVARQRAEPGEGVIGMLVREHGDELTDAELIGLSSLLMLGGYDNTASMLALGVFVLLEHPDQLAMLRDDPELTVNAVEEMLRYLSAVHAPVPRTAVSDVTLGGQQIKAGEMVICSFASANRDEALGDDLTSFDITRTPTPHFGFGHGVHHCIAAPLARMEMRVAYPALLRRFPTLRSAIPLEDVRFQITTPTYGVESLPVTW
jgi:cytochrome P450